MVRVPRHRVTWRREEVAHRRRFVLTLAWIGALHGIGLWFGGRRLPWIRELAYEIELGSWLLLPLVPSAWLVGWLCRVSIAKSRGPAPVALALPLSLFGAIVSFGLFFHAFGALSLLRGADDGLWMLLLAVPGALLFGLFVGVLYLPVSWPLTWLAVRFLRWASGGVLQAPPPRMGAARRRARA